MTDTTDADTSVLLENNDNSYGAINSKPGTIGFTTDDLEVDDLSPFADAMNKADSKNMLGVLQGVFVPVNLSIFGIILFERLGWVVGQSGLWLAFFILFSGYAMVTITALSVSALATNGNMKGGGAYFMISRSLGPAFGGAIGVIFYCANISAGGTYMLGFIEIIQEVCPDGFWKSYFGGVVIGSIALLILFVICMVGAGAYAKAAVFIFIAMWFAILSTMGSLSFLPAGWNNTPGFTGWNIDTLKGNLDPGFVAPETFQRVFAVFFPAVTGIMAGANMSGDLANPGKSIPVGTLAAIVVTAAAYSYLILVMAFTINRQTLITNELVMMSVCYWPPVIILGIVASALSSALGALIGASRIMQALARDDLIPVLNPFAVSSAVGDEPRRAVLLTYALIQGTVFAPNVNVMASVTTMFFLLSYGAVNLACFVLRISGSPNFRPTFRYFNEWLSLLGAVMCIGGMFYVNPLVAAISVMLLSALYLYIVWRSVPNTWGDVSQAIIYHQVRKYLLRLDVRKEHVKYWRPQILLLIRDPRDNLNLIDFVNNLKKGGLYILGSVLEGNYQTKGELLKQYQNRWLEFVAEQELKAFPEIVLAPTAKIGIESLLFSAGIGAMKPNTVVLGFPQQTKDIVHADINTQRSEMVEALFSDYLQQQQDSNIGIPSSSIAGSDYIELIKEAIFFNKNILIARNFEAMDKDVIVAYRGSRFLRRRQRLTIDMWPIVPTPGDHSYDSSIALSLLLGWILKQTDIWTTYSKLRVKSFVVTPAQVDEETQRLEALCEQARVPARVHVTVLTEKNVPSFQQAVKEGRCDADGMRFNDMSNYERYKIISELIKMESETTCVTFITMPHVDSEADADQYLFDLDALTAGLPPVVLVHASASVLTNEL